MGAPTDSIIIEGHGALCLRSADVRDAETILSFIRALAEYEHLEHEVMADEAKLKATLFGDRPAAEVVLAELEGVPVGFALYFQSYSTFLAKPGIYLEDLFVLPSHRGYGIGRALMRKVASVAVARGCGRFEWSVLDWNTPSIRFYESLGAVAQSEWTVHRMTGDALGALARGDGGPTTSK